jgi:hypothetical protein
VPSAQTRRGGEAPDVCHHLEPGITEDMLLASGIYISGGLIGLVLLIVIIVLILR